MSASPTSEPALPSSLMIRTGLVACAVLEEELRHFGEKAPALVEQVYLEQGLHNEPGRLREELCREVRALEARRPDLTHIVIGYGLCSRGIEGVSAERATLVIPRAHDCITLLLGSKKSYEEYVKKAPGTYWYSPGWNRCHLPPGKERFEHLRCEYCEKYGEDNADYLMEMEQTWMKEYSRATFVDLGTSDTTRDKEYTRQCADWLGWSYDEVSGDPGLVVRMLQGPWDHEDFLLVAPGHTLRAVADERVIDSIPLSQT